MKYVGKIHKNLLMQPCRELHHEKLNLDPLVSSVVKKKLDGRIFRIYNRLSNKISVTCI